MFRNFILIAFRNIIRSRLFSIINILGLAISMSVCLLIISIIVGLSQYDRFNENYKHIFRILSKKEGQGDFHASSPMPLRSMLLKDYPAVGKIVTFKKGFGGDASYRQTTVPLAGYFCSRELFDVFSFKLESGNPEKALRDPFSVILTRKSAKKLFGNSDPMGKIIRFNERGLVMQGIPNKNKSTDLGDYTVTGVLREPPGNSHIEFEILASLSTLPVLENRGLESSMSDNWSDINQSYSYVLMKEGFGKDDLDAIISSIPARINFKPGEPDLIFGVQPLSEITPGKLYSNPFSIRLPLSALYILSFLAAIVMLSACFNYTNLSLAKSISRAKEVGIRKISGAYRYQLMGQFIWESILISFLALIMAVFFVELLKPAFNSLWFTRYVKFDMANDPFVYGIFLVFSIVIGVLAGLIPALYISSYQPIKVLKNFSGIKVFRKLNLRKSLVVVQYAISLFFILTTLTLFYQIRYLMHADFGFNKDNIINIPLNGNSYDQYANAIRDHAGIQGVSGSSVVLATGGNGYGYLKVPDDITDSLGVTTISANKNYIDLMGLKIIAGDNFPEDLTVNGRKYLLINETGCEKMGFNSPREIVGKELYFGNNKDKIIVAGVLSDFHFSDFMKPVSPLIISCNPGDFRYVNVQVYPGERDNVMKFLNDKWKAINKGHAFEPRYLEDQLEETHAIFADFGYIIGFISFLAITIACLGLLGMVLYITRTRIKEIGIRKVLGARTSDVIIRLSGGFLILLVISIVLATPVAWMFNELLLQQFAVRISINLNIIGGGILIMFLLGIMTVFSQTYSASETNPVDVLKYE